MIFLTPVFNNGFPAERRAKMKKTKLILPMVIILFFSFMSLCYAGPVDLEVKIVIDKQCKAWILFKNAGTTAIDHNSVPYNTYAKTVQGSWQKVYGSYTGLKLNPGQEFALQFKPQGYTLFGERTLKANADPKCAVLGEAGSACNNNEIEKTFKCIPKQKLRKKMN
jgi:hypothetical protein